MKKRILALFLSFCLVVSGIMICPNTQMQVQAENEGDTWDSTETYWYREVESGKIEITGYTGDDTEIDIPSTIDSKTVVRIDDNAFYSYHNNTSDVTSITIPNTVISIGHYAFRDCDALTSITIPDSVTTIESQAFDGCEALPSITIPSSVTSIGESAFLHCSVLTNITVDANNANYSSDDGNLYNKTKSELVTYAPGKTESSFAIPNSVAFIGESAFYGCRDELKSVTIPDTVVEIKRNAFYATELTSITIPENVKIIGESAFSECHNLESITLEEGITTIAEDAFSACTELTTITIPEGVTSIGSMAFYFCSKLESITIPASVTSIGTMVFNMSLKLGNINVSEDSDSFVVVDDILYTKDKSRLIYCLAAKTGDIEIPASVTEIDYDAFDDCDKENITFVCEEFSAAYYYAEDKEINCRYTPLPRCAVTFDANGGTKLSEPSRQIVKNFEIGELPTVERDGYTFLGWFTHPTGGLEVTEKTVIVADMTLYAHWQSNSEGTEETPQPAPVVKYTVTFDENGGSKLSMSSMVVDANAEIGALPTVQKVGYTFKGWYTKKSGGTKVTASTKVTQNQTLYAQWKKVSKPKKVSRLSVKSAKTKQMTVKYKKVSGAEGYEITYSTSKKFKKAKKTTATKTNTTITKLSKKKTYYVKVRAYKVDSAGKKVYGTYSKVAKVKTK